MAQAATGGLAAQDREDIDALTREFLERMLAGDSEGLSQLYSADAVLLPPNHPTVTGRSDIRAFLGNFPKVTRFTAENVEIDGRGDLAYVRGTYAMTLEGEDGAGVEDAGKYLEIRKRQPDGSWPMVVDMFSSDNAA